LPLKVDISIDNRDVLGELKRSGLIDLLQRLPKAMEGRIVRRGLYAGAIVLRKLAREKAPVRKFPDGTLSGALKRSIVAKSSIPDGPPGDKRLKARVSVAKNVFRRAASGGRIKILDKARKNGSVRNLQSEGDSFIVPRNYAHLVEFGHGGPHPAPAHPFMRPAFDEGKAAAIQAVADKIRLDVEEELRA
jgi:HK97 gp10 family phage protein